MSTSNAAQGSTPIDHLEDASANKLAWLVGNNWRTLHYVAGIDATTWDNWWEPDSVPGYQARQLTAMCGTVIQADLPGMMSRMGLRRCARCCDRLRIPRGNGAPVNDPAFR